MNYPKIVCPTCRRVVAVHPVSQTVVRHDPDDRDLNRDLVSCSGSRRRVELDGQLLLDLIETTAPDIHTPPEADPLF